MPSGTVKWFNRDKGFGFIAPDEGTRDIYVQTINIEPPQDTLEDGQRVEYEVTLGRKGPEATHVKVVS